MAGETNIGGIVGFLRLEADQFHREIGRALAEIELLDGKRVDIRVDIDRTGAASIAATEAQVEKLDSSVKKVDKSTRSARGGMGALATAVIALGPAMVPLAAGAVGLAAAFGGMGTAGVLAIVGIKREMEAGTATGLAFGSAIGSAKADMQDLAGVAARNVLRPFQDAVADLNDRMPALTGQIGELATVTGKAAGALAGGLLSAFQQLEPLMRDVSVYVLDLSRRFREAMSGPGVVAFGDYVRSVFPQVVQDVEAIVGAVAHLIAALAPLGLGTLGTLRMLADLINAIPVDVLAVIAQSASAVFFGFKAWQGLSVLIGGVSTALETLGVRASTAAVAIRGLQAAAGIIGVAIAALSFIFTQNAEAQRQATQGAQDLTDALERSNGVIDENVRLTALKLAQDQGLTDLARSVGVSTNDVVAAMLGEAGALERVQAAYEKRLGVVRANNDGTKGAQLAIEGLNGRYDELTGKLQGQNAAMDVEKQKRAEQKALLESTTGAVSNQAIAVQTLANTYGVSTATFQAVQTSQKGLADKAAQATLQMQLENNAAGLLKQSLDLLNGETLSAAQTQNTFDSALANMGTHVTKTGKQVTFTTTSINNMSAASVALRGQLLGQVQNAEQAAEAFGQMKDSTEAGRLKLIDMRQQIIENAVAHGVDRKAVESYIDQVLKIPKSVPPTKVDLDTASALAKKKALQAAINAITGRTVTVTIQQVYKTLGQQAALSVHQLQTQSRRGIDINQANGGIRMDGVRKMAEGGFAGRESMIMRSTKPILWNEAPGGEAYISLAPEKRARSREVWAETGKLLGARAGGGGMTDDNMRTLARLLGDEIRQIKPGLIGFDKLSKGLV